MKAPIILLDFYWVPDNIWIRTLKTWWFKVNDDRVSSSGISGLCMRLPPKYVVAILKKDLHKNYYKWLLMEKYIIDEFEADYHDYPF